MIIKLFMIIIKMIIIIIIIFFFLIIKQDLIHRLKKKNRLFTDSRI